MVDFYFILFCFLISTSNKIGDVKLPDNAEFFLKNF